MNRLVRLLYLLTSLLIQAVGSVLALGISQLLLVIAGSPVSQKDSLFFACAFYLGIALQLAVIDGG